jgi:hypothetical protein
MSSSMRLSLTCVLAGLIGVGWSSELLAKNRRESLQLLAPGLGSVRVSYDPSQITKEGILILAPYGLVATEDPAEDLTKCAGWSNLDLVSRCLDDPKYFPKAAESLAMFQELLAGLGAFSGTPPAAALITRYLLTLGNFKLYRARAEFQALRSGSSDSLKETHDTFDPKQSCAAAIAKFDAATKREDRYRAATFDWANCANQVAPSNAAYPRAAWEQFKKRYGILETFSE